MKYIALILTLTMSGCAVNRINDPCRQAIVCSTGAVQNEITAGQGFTNKTAEIRDARGRRVGSVMSKY